MSETLILIILTVSIGVAYSQEECTPLKGKPRCVCKTDQGVIDLTSISSKNLEPYFENVKDPKGFVYRYNPCYPLVCNSDQSAAICQGTSGYKAPYVSCGETPDEVMLRTSKGHYLLQYDGGDDGRISQVLLICNKSADKPTLTADGDSKEMLNYVFHLQTKCACPGACGFQARKVDRKIKIGVPIGPIGTAVLTLLVAGMVIYLVVGVIISKFHLYKTGTDVIPHKDFWLGLAGLVQDGCVFTFSPICNRNKRVMSGYEKL